MKPFTVFAFISLAICCASVSSAAPTYSIVQVGLDGTEHTRNDGFKSSSGEQLNEAGQARGSSARYNGSVYSGLSSWFFDGTTTIDIGLVGSEHTRNDGYKYSSASQLNDAGQVRGTSYRYNGGSADLGISAWLFDGTTTNEIGLVGSEHTRSDGYKYSSPLQLNEAGLVRGLSTRYNGGSTSLGSSVWLYDGSTTHDIGFTGAEYTRNDGYRYSYSAKLSESGKVAGYSIRYNSSTSFGASAWLYDGATTIDIGLTDNEHTRSDGYKSSSLYTDDPFINVLNETGQVVGLSQRFNGGSADLGRTAWRYDGATTFDVGLTGSEHTRNNGYKYSIPLQLNAAGQVRGFSYRYNGGSSQLGQSAWLYNGTMTIDIGLTGSEHTRSDGYKYSAARQLNEAGQVSGYSYRYNGGSASLGQTAWLYDGAATVGIGLTGSEYTRNDGYQYSAAIELNEAGQVSGSSNRYNGSAALGFSTWLYNGATTVDIGLTDSGHARNDGYKYSSAQQLNEAAQVRGYSYRYNGSAQVGQDAWFYDPGLNQTFALTLSTRSDGFAYSRADYLGEDGLVLGTYTLFDEQDNNLGNRAFYFTIADGVHDLGSLVEGGLGASGWDWLAGAPVKPPATSIASGLGQILGYGKLTSQSSGQMAYLLTPVNPLPGDYNYDGHVDAADYMVWRKTLGQTGPVLAADGNRDHHVDAADFDVWRINFGNVLGASIAVSSTSAAVPEPAAWMLCLSLAAGLSFRRQRTLWH